MRKWGMAISAFYALILLVLLLPVFLLLAQSQYHGLSQFLSDLAETYGAWETWVVFGVLCSGQALLLFLSVDTTQKRLKPRGHIFLSCLVASSLTAVLSFAVIGAIGVAVRGDKFGEGSFANPFIFFGGLLKGSILEMLVAIPCHVIVRRRQECSAPAVTSFGIVSGIAIMLISFGPSVLFLYKKRLDTYATRPST